MPATASSSRRAGRKAVEIEPENDHSAVHKDEPSTLEGARSRRRAVKVCNCCFLTASNLTWLEF